MVALVWWTSIDLTMLGAERCVCGANLEDNFVACTSLWYIIPIEQNNTCVWFCALPDRPVSEQTHPVNVHKGVSNLKCMIVHRNLVQCLHGINCIDVGNLVKLVRKFGCFRCNFKPQGVSLRHEMSISRRRVYFVEKAHLVAWPPH